ncbi:MAG: ABC transporter permease subunit [Pseudomonadota bacterium]|nr:ABC transporter permease subunit [Pseudomonadota bacterium]
MDRVVALIVFLLLWQGVSLWTGAGVVPSVDMVGKALVTALGTQAFWAALSATLTSTSLSVVIVVLIGVPLGAVLGISAFLRISVNLVVEFMRTIPPVAIIPLALLLFGPVLQMKLMVIVIGAIWPVLLHATYAVRDIAQVHRDLVASFRVPRLIAWRHVFVPSMLPSIALGIRISVTIALLISIACEVIGGAPGLGAGLLTAQYAGDLSETYAYIVMAAFLGLILNAITNGIVARLVGKRGRRSA